MPDVMVHWDAYAQKIKHTSPLTGGIIGWCKIKDEMLADAPAQGVHVVLQPTGSDCAADQT